VLINCNLQVRFQNLGTVKFCPGLMVCFGRGSRAVLFDLHFNESVILVVTLFTFMAYLVLSERLNFECWLNIVHSTYRHATNPTIKVRFHPITGHEGPERGVRVYLYSFFNLGARWVWVVDTTPRPLYPRERPDTHIIGDWVAQGWV